MIRQEEKQDSGVQDDTSKNRGKTMAEKKTEIPTNKTTVSFKAMMSSKKLNTFFEEEKEE